MSRSSRKWGRRSEKAEQRQDYYSPANASEAEGVKPALLGFTSETRFASRTVADTKFSLYEQYAVTDRFGLNLVCGSAEGVVTAEIQYDAGKFAREDVLRLAEQFALLTQGAAEKPMATVGELPLLPSAERDMLVREWNATNSDYTRDACIHYLFEQQVARTPNAPALLCAGERFTFAELNAKANQIAHLLREKGAGPNRPVALCAERSADMIVGLLAIVKAGGFYVPLAADLPAARLQSLLAQTETALALTQKSLTDKFSGWNGALVALDADADQWKALPTSDPEHRNSPDDLTYVIFTSGSTGVPKGVGNKHRGLVNYAAYIAARIGLAEATEPLHFGTVTTLSADLGNTSVFPSLAYGGCLHVIGYETAMDGERFGSYLRENPLDFLKITPSHLSALLASSEGDILPRKHLFLGGEAFTWDLLKQAQGRGSCQIVNHYGPTETTIGSLTYTASGGAVGPNDSATVPIGRPIANTRIYILDERGQPVPIGVSGELYIGGAGLASGYLNQPERTEERFVSDPFVVGEKMYRTGDRARYLSKGNVEFLGRIDDQVKIRGFRVEPGEVESVLRRHPNVREAVVLVTEDNQGAKRLVGYYVASLSDNATGTIFREYLSENLPDYMVPASLTALAELPLTPNGKIDRKALLAQEGTAAAPAYEAARNPTEEKLTEIWTQVLKVERVGIHEDFFALGGHSLLMTQILARIRSSFQVQLALHTLFDNPTIATLATVIDGEQMSGSEEEEMRLLLAELEGLSEDEVNELLSAESK